MLSLHCAIHAIAQPWNSLVRTDIGGVVGRAKDQLGRPVVSRADIADVGLASDENLGRTKVAQLQNARGRVEEQVLGLDVTVTDTYRVDVGKRPEELYRQLVHKGPQNSALRN